MAPFARLDAFTVKTEVALEPAAESVAEPSEDWPKLNAMLPVGGVLPDAGVNVTVN